MRLLTISLFLLLNLLQSGETLLVNSTEGEEEPAQSKEIDTSTIPEQDQKLDIELLWSGFKSITDHLDMLQRHHAEEYHSCYDYYDRGINKTGSYYITTKSAINSTKYDVLEKVHCDFEVLPFQTCWDHYQSGARQNGEYKAYLGGRTVTIVCDFTNQNVGTGNGSTVLQHDYSGTTTELSQCSASDCFTLNLTYDATNSVIEDVKRRSTKCSQTIQFNCFLTPLNPLASWTDVNGDRQTFFSGNNGTRVCDCALGENAVIEANRPNDEETTNTCFSEPYHSTKPPCNCDARDPVFRQDIGIITNKDLLPIKSFNYGFMTSSYQKANITIGPLVCNGPCSCNIANSKTKYCNRDGHCECKANFIGDRCNECPHPFAGAKCDKCKPGYFGNACENQIRLRGGDSRSYGYIQVLTNLSRRSEWKSLVPTYYDNQQADRICRALGFPDGHYKKYNRRKCGNWSPCSYTSYPTQIQCNSQAVDLKECTISTHSDSSYSSYAEVKCCLANMC